MKRQTFFEGGPILFIDQFGSPVWARSLKELRAKCPGKVVPQYADKKTGEVVRNGYVIGRRWLTAFRPLEFPA